MPPCWLPFVVVASPFPSARPSQLKHSCTRPTTTSRSPAGWATSSPTPVTAPASRNGSAPRGTGRPSFAMARTLTRRPPSMPTGAPVSLLPTSFTARRCPTTTSSMPMPPSARPTTTPSRPLPSSSMPTPAVSRSAPTSRRPTTAHTCDPVSAFGGVIATNRPVTAAMAERVAEVFTEVVIAPDFEPEALEILKRKKAIRLLRLPEGMERGAEQIDFRAVSGGVLMQTRDKIDAVVEGGGGDDPSLWTLVSGDAADAAQLADLAFAWRAIRAVKSNAILLAKDGASVGVGMGQVNRVDSCHLAVTRAGAVAASDAFFPFADGLQVLLDAGIRAVVAPGGSMRDAEVIEAATAAGVTMYFTGTRHFAH